MMEKLIEALKTSPCTVAMTGAPGSTRAPASAAGAPPRTPAAVLANMSQDDFEREFEDV